MLPRHSRAALTDSKRKSPRSPVQLGVLIVANGVTSRAHAANVGLGGMFIEGPPRSYGELLDVVVELPGLTRPARLPAIVRWSSSRGYGVQFLQLGAQVTYALSHLLAKHAA